VDVWVVERAVTAIREQFAQRLDRFGVGVLCAFERSGGLEQLGPYRGCAVVQQRSAAAGDWLRPLGPVSGPS
jgi:hypothetical protein